MLREERGLICAITEHWNPHARIRQDLFGFIDILAIGHDGAGGRPANIGVQTTSSDNVSKRVAKIKASSLAADWLKAGNEIEVHGWRLAGKAGQRKLWTCKVTKIVLTKTSSGLISDPEGQTNTVSINE